MKLTTDGSNAWHFKQIQQNKSTGFNYYGHNLLGCSSEYNLLPRAIMCRRKCQCPFRLLPQVLRSTTTCIGALFVEQRAPQASLQCSAISYPSAPHSQVPPATGAMTPSTQQRD
eukprot:1673637-Amphidinium_carterae.1